ncbi:hypothetical protein TD95_002625 [Thielaviopsis punctulata]|uniref:Mitochondrial intermembrane space import and assembly protein 40 n=1 Tax=Thielaviopsis punctulata TaxID=72032 RepID=A0A0F4ZJW1_9PEZI|nr:hypothetical protein TD95_002625 [Thielaviopsis punctulata]
MFRSSVRQVRPSVAASGFSPAMAPAARRALTTNSNAPKSTWKGSMLRLGLAIGAVYFYNTSPIFQDPPKAQTTTRPSQFSETDNLTIDAIVEARRKQIQEEKAAKAKAAAAAAAAAAEKKAAAAKTDAEKADAEKTPETETAAATAATEPAAPDAETTDAPVPGSPAALEAEAGQEGAFNPETGEINWDCPCLGGMAHGPCGEEFKAAFSCFVYSKEEPKGMDCIEKFQGMQTCFRAHPDIYGAELDDDEAAPPTEEKKEVQAEMKEEKEKEKEKEEEKAVKTEPKASS